MNRPTPISVFSDQRRTKSTTWSRKSCATQLPVRVPQVFFFSAMCSAINSARTSSLVSTFFSKYSIRFCFSSTWRWGRS